MSLVTDPVILDKTGRAIARGLNSIAAAMWDPRKEEIPPKDVNFYDYDGQIVYAYTKSEFLRLTELPANPAHDGLTAQGWNWTLAAAQAYVAAYGSCEIGQTYITDDGKTRLYIDIAETERYSISINYTQTVAQGVTVDWGDGSDPETSDTVGATTAIKKSHTYAKAGQYVVTLTVADGCTVMLGSSTTNTATSEGVSNHSSAFITSQYMGGRSPVRRLEIGSGVTKIGNSALIWCNLLEYITIPNTVTAIYQLAFCGCTKIKAIVVPMGTTTAGPFVFRGCQAATAICIPEGLTSLGIHAFSACVALRRVSIPEGITALGIYAFRACYALERCAIPDSVTSIGNYCFFNCYTLQSVHIGASVTAIPNYCFAYCHNLTGLELPEGILTIGTGAFISCFSIGSLAIPPTVTTIGQFAFLYGDGMKDMHMLGTTPPTLTAGTGGIPFSFGANAPDIVIYVPYSADHSVLQAYLSATGWATLGDYIQEEAA